MSAPTSPPETAGVDRRTQDVSRMARGGALNLAGSLVNALGSFVLVVILTRNLGAGRSGAFLEAVAVFQVLATAGQLGADTGLARFIPWSLTRGRADQLRVWTRLALVPVALVGVVTGALAYFQAEPLARLVAKGDDLEDFVTYLQVLAPLVPLGAVYFVLQTASRSFGTMKPSVIVERIGRALLQPAVMLLVFVAGLGSEAVAWAWIGPYVAAAMCLAVWYGVQIRRAERRSARLLRGEGTGPQKRRQSDLGLDDDDPIDSSIGTDVRADGRTFWRFASPRALAGLFQVAVMWLDVLLVGALSSTENAGIYSATSRWLVGGMFIAFAINQAFQPQISAVLAQADMSRATALFESATSWAVAFVWPIYLTVAVFSPLLMRVFGDEFDRGATALIVLVGGGLVAAACGPVDMVLLMGGKSARNLATAAVALVVNVAVNVALVPSHGIIGAAIAWTSSLIVANLVSVWQVRSSLKISGYGATWRRAVVAATLGAGMPMLVVRLLLGATVPGLILGIAAGALVYGAMLWRWRDILDVAMLRSAIRGRRTRVTVSKPKSRP